MNILTRKMKELECELNDAQTKKKGKKIVLQPFDVRAFLKKTKSCELHSMAKMFMRPRLRVENYHWTRSHSINCNENCVNRFSRAMKS